MMKIVYKKLTFNRACKQLLFKNEGLVSALEALLMERHIHINTLYFPNQFQETWHAKVNKYKGILKILSSIVTQSEKTGLIAHVSRFDFSPRTQSYMNQLSNSTIKIS